MVSIIYGRKQLKKLVGWNQPQKVRNSSVQSLTLTLTHTHQFIYTHQHIHTYILWCIHNMVLTCSSSSSFWSCNCDVWEHPPPRPLYTSLVYSDGNRICHIRPRNIICSNLQADQRPHNSLVRKSGASNTIVAVFMENTQIILVGGLEHEFYFSIQ